MRSLREGLSSHEMSGGSFKVKGMLRAFLTAHTHNDRPSHTGKRHTHTTRMPSLKPFVEEEGVWGGGEEEPYGVTSSHFSLFSAKQHHWRVAAVLNMNQSFCCGQSSPLYPLTSLESFCVAAVTQDVKLSALHDGTKLNLTLNNAGG